jgi:hypothetical protein
MQDASQDDLKDKELLNKTMDIVNTGEIVRVDTSVKDNKFSSRQERKRAH